MVGLDAGCSGMLGTMVLIEKALVRICRWGAYHDEMVHELVISDSSHLELATGYLQHWLSSALDRNMSWLFRYWHTAPGVVWYYISLLDRTTMK
jgi:hypothetical protein